MKKEIKKYKILVTGGAGFIGSHIVDRLIALGHKVLIIDDLSTGKKENINKQAVFYKEDIRNFEKIKSLFKGIDFVFHLAAQPRIQPSILDPMPSCDINIKGTLNALIASRDAKVKKFIYSASSSVYGNQKNNPLLETMEPKPKNPYAMAKYFGEIMCRVFNELYELPTVSLRYFNVYGLRQPETGAYATVIGIFLKQFKENKPFTIVPDGKQKRDYTFVGDVVEANILAMDSEKAVSGEAINIGTGKNYSIFEIANLIGGKNHKRVIISPRRGEAKITLADISKAKKILGWTAKISLKEGIERLKK